MDRPDILTHLYVEQQRGIRQPVFWADRPLHIPRRCVKAVKFLSSSLHSDISNFAVSGRPIERYVAALFQG